MRVEYQAKHENQYKNCVGCISNGLVLPVVSKPFQRHVNVKKQAAERTKKGRKKERESEWVEKEEIYQKQTSA